MDKDRISVGVHVTIFPRGRRRKWTADFWYGGQHCRRSLKTTNKKVAIARAVALDKELSDGTFQRATRVVLISPGIEQFLTNLETNDRAKRTIDKYRNQLHQFRDYCEANDVLRLNAVTPLLLDAYRAKMKGKHGPGTLFRETVTVKQFVRWCTSRGLLAKNPLADYRLQRPARTNRPAPSLDQVWQILDHFNGEYRKYLAMLAFTGVRSGELQRLRKEDVDFDGNWIHICSRPRAETKTRESRTVPMHPVLRSEIAKHESKGPWFFVAPPSRRFPDGGRKILIGRLNERFVAELKKLGLPAGRDHHGFTIHSLRRFFETHTVNSGIPQLMVDAWMGHRSNRSMANLYYGVSPEDSQKFMKKVSFEIGTPSANDGDERN